MKQKPPGSNRSQSNQTEGTATSPSLVEKVGHVLENIADIFSLGSRVVHDVRDLAKKVSKEELQKEADVRTERIKSSRKKGESK